MAALQSIRNRGVIIAIVIGLALLAFVLTDFINSSSAFFGQSQFTIAKVNGNSISYQDFMNRVEAKENFYKTLYQRSSLDGQMTEQIRNQVYNEIIDENTIGKNIENLGIRATGKELADLIKIGYVTPTIRQICSNQNGVYDPSIIQNIMQQVDQNPQLAYIWQNLEDEFKLQREQSKYITMIAQGLYVSKKEIEQEFAERTHIVDIKYVALPYSEIKDEDVAVSDKDLKEFYSQNQQRYQKLVETRDLAYVTFDVIPTKEDSAVALKDIKSLQESFEATSDPESFVSSKSDVAYRDYLYSKGDITNQIVDSLMFSAQEGTVYGPYLDEQYYTMARLISRKMIPDSFKVAHILVEDKTADTLATRLRADSLLREIKNGVDFGAMAMQYSDNKNSARDSGNLGWVTANVNFEKEFKDAVLSAPVNQLATVRTQYGVHIYKVIAKTAPKAKAKIAFVRVEVSPSKQTRANVYSLASTFAGKNTTVEAFENAIKEEGLIRKIAPQLNGNTPNVAGIEDSREMVRWAFNDDKSDVVSDVFEYGDRYVVACLEGINPRGYAQLEQVKVDVNREVLAQKKGEKIINELGNNANVEQVAAQKGKTVQQANALNLQAYQIPGMGNEPQVLAKACSMGKDESAIVAGKNAVYVIQNTSYTPSQQIQEMNYTTDKNVMENDLKSRATYQSIDAIRRMSDIEDLRVKFF